MLFDEVMIFKISLCVSFDNMGRELDQWCVCRDNVRSHLESSEASKRLLEHLPWTVQRCNLEDLANESMNLSLRNEFWKACSSCQLSPPNYRNAGREIWGLGQKSDK